MAHRNPSTSRTDSELKEYTSHSCAQSRLVHIPQESYYGLGTSSPVGVQPGEEYKCRSRWKRIEIKGRDL